MKIVNIQEAETRLASLIEDAINGEEVVIAKENEPVVRLVLVEPVPRTRRRGWAKGMIVIKDDFDEPLADFDEYR